MLTVEEMHNVTKRPRYIISKWPCSNMKFIRGSYKSSDLSVKIAFDFKFNAEKISDIGTIQLMIWHLFKPILIAIEIGDIRSRVIESYLNETVDDDNLYDIFNLTHYWLEYKVSKINVLRVACISFLKDPRIEKIIFDACKHLGDEQKKQQYNGIICKLDKQFVEILEKCELYTQKSEKVEAILKLAGKDQILNMFGKQEILKLFDQEGTMGAFIKNWDSGLLTDDK